MSNLTYEKAGVDIKGGDHWVETIKGILKQHTADPRVVGGIGGFSGLMRLSGDQLIAGCCDGVGTKVEIARASGIYDGLGQDLVAMNVNDLVTGGAKPLFFLDYIACGALNEKMMSAVVKSVVNACEYCGCVLLGGETAEMPGVYGKESFDLAGFAVGALKESEIIDGHTVKEGDVIIGLHSSGVHSNGYTLVRSALADEIANGLDKEGPVPGETLGETLMKPTRLYVPQAIAATKTGKVKAMAHITGSGLEDNINRVVPAPCVCKLTYDWPRPAVFDLVASKGVEEEEMRHVFNLGIGYVFIVDQADEAEVTKVLADMGEQPRRVGTVVRA
ncbi:MAG: phosphoribosylformylglycinamidine cyclo-ligase [Pyramidobacter sp.]|nr:phosphoribosylformylglycinamidine cyclo-ligase [Pyramidobacter sp.]